MDEAVKYCARCGCEIAREFSCDWYHFLRIKYCPTCKAEVIREQAKVRMRAFRLRKKEGRLEERTKLQEAYIKALASENEILRLKLLETYDRIEELENGHKRANK